MTDQRNESLDIYENLRETERALHLARDLVEFFSEEFSEEMTHDDSEQTRKRLRTIRKALIKDMDKLGSVLCAIDPDLVLKWQLGYCDFENDDVE